MKTKLLVLLLALLPLSSGAQAYQQALPGYQYQFPRDYFNHPDYQTEWWYYTGNLRAKDGHRFGFELTFFRQGVSLQPSTSPWDVRDLYMAHLALSDISGGHYHFAERLNRTGPGLAGIDAPGELVWNGNWHTHIGTDTHVLQGIDERFRFTLNARPLKAPVIQGQDGISQKAEGTGHASHYISLTSMATNGTVELDGKQYTVDGDAWMDHEFFSDSLSNGEVGWDWLSIQLNDHCELMLYRLRHSDGSVDPYSSGTYVDAQGRATHLSFPQLSMTATGTSWKSERTGAVYPLAWTVAIPSLQLQVHITTPLKQQEFVSRFGPSYWEGAIDVSGSQAGQSLQGSGYLEMTGYAPSHRSVLPTSPR